MNALNEINELYKEINNIYLDLYGLELDGCIGNCEFLDLVELLKKKVCKEKKLFNNFYNEYDGDYDELFEKLRSNASPFYMRMNDYISFDNAMNVSIYEEDNEEVINDKLNELRYAKLYIACSKNIFLIYLSFLQEYAKYDDFDYLKDKLLAFKYHNAFINHDVENTLIENKFNVFRTNYVNLYFIADTLGLNLEESDNIILNCYLDTIIITMKQILSIKDSDYVIDDKKTISINNQSMLRAAMAMLSESEYSKIKINIEEEKEKYINEFNKISSIIIDSIFKERKKDRVRVRKISIRPIED